MNLLTLPIAVRSAQIRAEYRLRTPDAIQLATAIESQATLFVTNDLKLPGKVGPLTVLFLKDYLKN
ncbi:PIN domain-containing protein [Syntrophothermus sp.]|uniref:type II toxin-antitoxin system VapC family toxin n=1 Tax=Syntrophothermus sp. TaxID=2736299 RepID=UPI002359D8F2|nr:PIN domain-containing protein [Syntrophothermus sp.]